MSLTTETAAHKKQLTTWTADAVLKADDVVIATLDSVAQEERSSIVGSRSIGSAHTESKADSSSGSDQTVKIQGGDHMEEIPITIVAVVVPAVLAIGVTLAFVIRKRKRMQNRDTDAILDLPHPFGKLGRDRSETSGNFTVADSELSRSRMSSGEIDHHDTKDRASCVVIAVTHTDAYDESSHQHESSTSANVGYVNLASPQDFHASNTRRRASFRDGETVLTHLSYSVLIARPVRRQLKLVLQPGKRFDLLWRRW